MKEPMKVIAYTGQHSNEIVTALQGQIRRLNVFYSCHKPGERLEMYKTHRNQTHYFAYKSKNKHEGKTAPETLTHTLRPLQNLMNTNKNQNSRHSRAGGNLS